MQVSKADVVNGEKLTVTQCCREGMERRLIRVAVAREWLSLGSGSMSVIIHGCVVSCGEVRHVVKCLWDTARHERCVMHDMDANRRRV